MYKIFSWIVVILWMSFIFYLSHQTSSESGELSSGVTALIQSLIETVLPASIQLDFSNFHFYIRKTAHFVIYFILGILVINALRASSVIGFKSTAFALVICFFYAISDEIHQTFVPGRSGEVRDVIIDTAGASVGIAAYFFVHTILRKVKTR